jgi:integrase
MNVYWFPREAGYVFMYVWKKYLQQRIRYGIKDTHPFAFVSFDPRYLGEMMPIRTQTEAHNKACETIGLEVSKFNGTSNHGHRHSYGQRMKNAGIDKKVRQVAMHHKSEESQNVYTEPTVTEVTSALSQATSSLERGIALPMKTEIDSWYEEEKKITKKYIMGKK